MPVQTLKWQDDALILLDQTRLPQELVYETCRDVETVAQAIEVLMVRGAPAIGLAARSFDSNCGWYSLPESMLGYFGAVMIMSASTLTPTLPSSN